ncbi:hypothetical protein CROQUDRAFT_43539, partial [Cronartium quercuum f. sp. fusiforme G11]
LAVTGIKHLKPPGPNTNYLDWSFIVELHLWATNAAYVLQDIDDKDKPSTWAQDNVAVCSVITKMIHPGNIQYICKYGMDVCQMWEALKTAHQASISGNHMYFLQKLVLTKMVDDDVEKHINEMTTTFDKLNALVTPLSPLTPDNIFSMALLLSLPALPRYFAGNWLHCVSAMMNQSQVPSAHIVAALKQEALHHAAQSDPSMSSVLASKTFVPDRGTKNIEKRSTSDYNAGLFCTFCCCHSHNLLTCNNAECILMEHKQNQHTSCDKRGHSGSQRR